MVSFSAWAWVIHSFKTTNAWTNRPRLHGSGQIIARTKTCTVPPCIYMGPAELDKFFERLSVQVWDLKKAGRLPTCKRIKDCCCCCLSQTCTLSRSKSAQFCRSHVNARWNRASFCPCRQKFVRTRVNGALLTVVSSLSGYKSEISIYWSNSGHRVTNKRNHVFLCNIRY